LTDTSPLLIDINTPFVNWQKHPLCQLAETPLFRLVEISPLSIGRNTPFVNWQKHSLCQLAKTPPLSIGKNTPLSIGRNEFGDCENPMSI